MFLVLHLICAVDLIGLFNLILMINYGIYLIVMFLKRYRPPHIIEHRLATFSFVATFSVR